MSAKEANRKSQKLFPLVKMGAKHGGVTIHLNLHLVKGNHMGYANRKDLYQPGRHTI